MRPLRTSMPNFTTTALPRFRFSYQRTAASPRLRVWANDLHPAAGSRVDREPKAVQLHDRSHQIEAKTDARRVSHLVGTIEASQHDLALLLADAGTGIGDAHDGLVVAAYQFNAHLAAFGRELDGVVDEVSDRLEQQIPVSGHVKRGSAPAPQSVVLFLRIRSAN